MDLVSACGALVPAVDGKQAGGRGHRRTSMGIVIASLGCPPPPVFFSSVLLFSDGVDCEGSACPATADDEVGLEGCTASGVWARPGGGRLGGGIDVSMEGFASPGDGAGMVVEGAGEPSMGAKRAAEDDGSLLREASLFRDDMARYRLGVIFCGGSEWETRYCLGMAVGVAGCGRGPCSGRPLAGYCCRRGRLRYYLG